MRLLSLDQASNNSGFALWEDHNLIKYGIFSVKDITPKNEDFPMEEKITNVKHFMEKMIDTYSIDYVVLENVQKQANVKTFRDLSKLLGVLANYLYQKEIPYIIISPSEWRKILKIKGQRRTELKKNAQKFVNKEYNIQATEDEADAICIGKSILKNGIDKWEWVYQKY